MSDFIVVGLFFCAASIGVAVVYTMTHWELFCDSIEHLPENIDRLKEWHKRRALRRWYKILNVIGGKNNAE